MKLVDCDVIKDLMPSYIDKLSSESTNKLVEKHLQSCKNCCMTLNTMQEDLDTEIIENEEEKVDYLKGYRRNKIRGTIFAVLITIIIFIVSFIADLMLADTYSHIEMFADINKVNAEYMYTRNGFGHKMVDIFFYSDKYKNLTGEYLNREDGSRDIYFKISSINRIKSIFGTKNYYSNKSGLSYSFCIDDIDRIYITDKKGSTKEIWNKDMEVMTKEEWKNWYRESYFPEEAKEVFNIEKYSDIICYDTGKWRHLYSPKGK